MPFVEKRREEMQVYMERDPAARNFWEIALCSPGLHAVWLHRLNHRMWNWGACLLARFLSHLSRFLTGVEIHPAAVLGERVFIDHGMGIVIGASAEIGDDCSIYQGVTLGGTTQTFRGKRHPTLGAGVIVGAGAKILGPIIIGAGARIGSNAVVVKEVPPGCTAVGVPARVLEDADAAAAAEDSAGGAAFAAYAVDGKSESCEDMIETLSAKIAELEKKIAETESKKSAADTGGDK
ncbi:MAG: serine O-acetyltransferase [Gammaproteobacteria bacterium]